MPIYEYECRDCGHRFEKLQKMSDRRVRTCPECKGKVDRLVSAPAIQFKGSGWYVTDYSDKGKEAKKAAKEEQGGGESKASESKAAESKAAESKAAESKSGESKAKDKSDKKASAKKDTGGKASGKKDS